jgi:hypothetical protein
MRAFIVSLGSLVLIVAFLYAFTGAIQNPVYQNGLTSRFDALQQTKRVQAQEFGDTMRTWGMWGGGGLAVVGGLVVIGWAVNRWQEQRTQRHVATEEQTTERHLISAKRDIVLAYLVQFGEPGAKPMMLNGVYGAYLPSANEFVPEDVCRAELATVRTAQPANQGTALARRQPQTINVPAAMERDDWPRVGLSGDDGGRRFRVIGELEEW